MKMGMKTTVLASVLALTLAAGNGMAQSETDSTAPQQQVGGKMMHGDKGMMHGGKGKMGMMHGKKGMMQDCMSMKRGHGGMGHMKMMEQRMMKGMSADNQQKFMDATKEMRKEMHMMRFEHKEAMRNPETTLGDLTTMEQKMLDIRKEMMEKTKAFQDQTN